MNVHKDFQKTGRKKNKHRVRIIEDDYERLVCYFDTHIEALAAKKAVKRMISMYKIKEFYNG